MPDIAVLVEISKLFNVNLDYLISEEHDKNTENSINSKHEYSRGVITSVSVLLVWFIAVFVFVVVVLASGRVGYGWLSFIYAIPVSAIVWLVLNSLWFNRKSNYLIISLLMWSLLLSVHLSLLTIGINVCLIYLIGIPAQVIIILWSVMKRKKKI